MITKTVDEAQLIKNYYKRFLRMDFDGAMKTVGVMTYYRVPDARYYEALLLYELRKFNKVRILLCDKSLSWRERELYIASLAELQLYNDVEDALDNEIQLYNESINLPDRYFPISTYAFYYICYLLEKSGHPYTKTITTTMVEDTYFQDHYKWTIFFDLAEINETNKEISLMKAAQFSKNTIRHTRKKALDMLALIRINDPFLDDIKNAVNSNLEIEIPKLLWFPIRYLGDSEPNGTPKMFHSFSNIYSIIRYTHFLIRLNYPNVELDTFVEYIKELEAEADYTSCSSILCYHYTYCDLTAEYDQKTVAEDLLTCLDHNVEYDPFIAFREEKDIESMSDEEADKLVKTFKQQMMAFIGGCSMSQLVAITVLYCAFDSLALPYYIVKETMGETACSTDDFVTRLSAYCKREGIDLPADMPATISAFCEYWNI